MHQTWLPPPSQAAGSCVGAPRFRRLSQEEPMGPFSKNALPLQGGNQDVFTWFQLPKAIPLKRIRSRQDRLVLARIGPTRILRFCRPNNTRDTACRVLGDYAPQPPSPAALRKSRATMALVVWMFAHRKCTLRDVPRANKQTDKSWPSNEYICIFSNSTGETSKITDIP